MKKLILWLYTSPENIHGRSPLQFNRKTISVTFFIALSFCMISGNLVMLGLYRFGEAQLREAYFEINVSSDTGSIQKVEALVNEKFTEGENKETFVPLFEGKRVTFNSVKHFLEEQGVSTLQLEQRILGDYSPFPFFSLHSINTIGICQQLGFQKPPRQEFKRLTEKDIKFYALFKCIDNFRNQLKEDYSKPLRLIICFSGAIQWLTYISAVFGSILLLLRIHMVRLQRRLVLTGNLARNSSESLWQERSIPVGGIINAQIPEPVPYLWKLSNKYPGLLLLVLVIAATKHAIGKKLSFDDQKNLIREEVTMLRNKTESDYTLTDFIGYMSSSLGFLGTIVGIILAFGFAKIILGSTDSFERLIAFDNITSALSTAFDTTAIGLVCSLVLNYLSAKAKSNEANLFETLEKTSIINLKKGDPDDSEA